MLFKNKPEFFGKLANSRSAVEKVQEAPRTSWHTREKVIKRLQVSRRQFESVPTGQRCENVRLKKDINCNELKHMKLFESMGL